MKCPNCGYEAAEGTDECPKCQLVFRKWQDRAERQAVEEHVSSTEEPGKKDDSSLTLRLFVMFLVCAGLYWLVRPSDKQADSSPAPETTAAPAQPAGDAPGQDAQQLAVAGPAEARWGFEGKVVDLLDGKPVLGAKIYFSDPSTGRNFSTETDYDGHYSLEVKPLEAGGYLAQIMHPEFEGRWWEGKNAKLGKKQRYQLAGRSAGDAIAYSGKSGAGTVVDFAVVPKTLTPEEKKDLCSAAPNSPACSK